MIPIMGGTMTAEPVPGWMIPPADGFDVDDYLDMADRLPPHTELLDGSLVFVSPQRIFHFLVIDLLMAGLRRSVPEAFRVAREMTVVLDRRSATEPDVSVVRAEAFTRLTQTTFDAKDVLLAVEVVSPESEARDRSSKPLKYAAVGIPHFWRVDMSDDLRVVVHVHALDPATGAYVETGVHRNRLKLEEPFPIDIDLTSVEHL
jgi:Uma2 family endonuclease